MHGVTLGAALTFAPALALGQPVEGDEAASLRALHEAERALFRPVGARTEGGDSPRVLDRIPSALTSDGPPRRPETARGEADLSWLRGIALPDLPVRWDERVVRFLEYFRSDPRGRQLMSGWIQRSTRYGAMIDRELSISMESLLNWRSMFARCAALI